MAVLVGGGDEMATTVASGSLLSKQTYSRMISESSVVKSMMPVSLFGHGLWNVVAMYSERLHARTLLSVRNDGSRSPAMRSRTLAS